MLMLLGQGMHSATRSFGQGMHLDKDSIHCGVCYPLVSGHEIAGVVTEIGSYVKGFKVGDHVGIGTYVDSCRDCECCNDFLEVHCSKGSIATFNSIDIDGAVTKGGWIFKLHCSA